MDNKEKKLNFLLTATLVSSLATRLMLEDLCERTPLKEDFKMKAKWAIGQITDKLESCKSLYDTYVHPQIVSNLKDEDTGKFSSTMYDDNLRDANECARLQLLYWNKCFNDFDNVNAVFNFLRELPGGNEVFSEKDINHYRLK